MESINTLKGYDKVSDQENQSPLPKPSSRKTLIVTISIISLLLLLTVVALTAGAFTHPPPKPSLKTICGLTRYPETCLNSLSSSPHKLDLDSILESSIKLASDSVTNLSLSFRSINDTPEEEPAITDCVKLYNDALSQLNESMSEIETEKKKGGNWLSENVIGDVKTWISAAMTDGETCSDGLEEMGTVVGKEIKKEMEVANQIMSISLAIVTQFKNLH
ncbi:hypothetical protein AALP_AA5G098300 [Arabis alpina]|uniref:pectinesterase n=1 Tax=Arabis alpina TaxID=50452 RepID=A0A087GW17_ARAAL|nr:hypothetical protein AALP_AA5G098300 [Arabis alpina]